ncbi:helix-turn-helix domain-containing protein [Spirosoma sp. KCTC 42546]|uniref:helix-turn-helix domain-containing protein n=1 Tax=Spirosoma sp. KCTC 42546 TaxID=2520506 RepID=UPI00115972C3|nr:helix-turn-helix domain-containing protein [Spirosoma sp. KCTC 42546]QDK81286.1 helix-turn-helix domain-containing protein [Spirosoma sp. KCTC 42546]
MKAENQKPYVFASISELMKRLEQPKPVHPLIALVNYDTTRVSLADAGASFSINFYKISFKHTFKGQVKYGQGYYDFEEGGLAFLAPNQVVTMSGDESSYDGYSLYFHPDFIRHYPLGKTISKYGFFSYAVSEALFLSDREKQIIAALFATIATELDTNIDSFSQDVLVTQIELLLTYSNRFYNRQFLTRKAVYNDMIAKLDGYLASRLGTQQSLLAGLPSVKELADYLAVSPRFLTDMLKSLTGQSTQQYIHNWLIEQAKDRLSTSRLTVAEIAYELGFEHPQSFNKLFKQKTNVSPVEFRLSFH